MCHVELFVGQVPGTSPCTCVDIKTFWLLVQLLYHKTTGDLWELWLLIKTKFICCSFADEESSLNLYSLHRLIVIWLSVCWHISAVLSKKVRAFNSSYYLHLTSNIFMTYAKLTDRPQTEQPNCLSIDRSKLTRTNKWLVTNFKLILEQMLNWPTSFHRPDLWHYQLLADKHFSLDSQGDFHTGCQNVIQQPQ